MLTVIAIIGIIAGLSVPLLKNFGKSDISVSASRQMLDDIGHARQLAMSQRATVYMVFLPTNFWVSGGSAWLSAVNANAQSAAAFTNLLDKQLTGYTFMAYGALGDQPGQHQWHYLAPWQSLPDGVYIPLWKFYNPAGTAFSFSDPMNPNNYFNINPFSTNSFPAPTTNANQSLTLSYVAFNYLGQLANSSGQLLTGPTTPGYGYDNDFVGGGVDIPIAQGAVMPYIDQTTHALLITTPSGQTGSPQVVENPPGNTTNISYNVIHIDALTGRATLQFHKVQ